MQQGHSETPVVGSSRIFNNKTRLLVIGIVLALALGYLVYAAFPGNTLYYLTVDEFLADEQNMDGRSIRVVGRLVPESLQRAPSSMERQFSITAKDVVLPAAYDGPLPDLFENPHSEIVLEGRYGNGDVFHVDTVIVKCPSKYQALRQDG